MRAIRSITPLAAVLALAACGGGGEAPAASKGTEKSATSSAAPSVDASTSAPSDQGGEDDGEEQMPEVPWGQVGHYSSEGKGFPKGEGLVDVQLTNWECDEDGQLQGAPEGKKYCVFEVKLTNVGRTPYQADEPGAVELTNGQVHDPSSEDQDLSWRINEEKSGTYVMDLNPGDSFTYYHAVAVPKEGQPRALYYPAQTLVEVPNFALIAG